ncbi:lectin [Thermomonas aquatica]|uniref:Lectin n=1 Tax=Thermomonas aquatica TaxID=2202149 RepID=A0A5B7ZPQ5_9GAMM|nr:lectin [Thermomonas aquatica]QDA57040.1 lectin [Thermomonas aquatica]
MRALLSLGLLAALGACTAERAPPAPPEVPADVATDAAPASPSPSPSPAAETPASAAAGKSAATPDGDLGMATFAGYGEVKFGTLAADMGKAWGGALKEVGKDFNASCYFMTPAWVKTPAEFNFMISEGRFARFGTDSAKYAAPGGGKVGMRESELQKLYNNALHASPHKYSDGKYLSLAASGVAPTKLVFETDAQGVVTEWRVGVLPEVDYVEGCS